jgi:circadian clock protein KaiC
MNPSGSFEQRTITTGVPGLDEVLGGGLLSAGMYLIEGRAGAGKTILASHIAFHRAATGDRVLYVTLSAEAHGKLLNHLRPLVFYEEAHVGQSLILLNGYAPLRAEGLDGFLRSLAELLRARAPRLMVIDGFRAAIIAAEGERGLSAFLHQLDVLVTGLGCATLLLAPPSSHDASPEHTLVDGVIELTIRPARLRRVRVLEVRKLRGADHLTGQHVFRISKGGIQVFGRLECTTSRDRPAPGEFDGELSTGIPTLDAMLAGGIPRGTSTGVLGEPGSGKTLLGLSFLAAGLQNGERVTYFGFYESIQRLMATASGVGIQLEAARRTEHFDAQWRPPLELLLDEVGQSLLGSVMSNGVTRLFVDGVDAFRDAGAFPERVQQFMVALTLRLRAAGVTTMFAQELPLFSASLSPQAAEMSPVFENVMLLRYVETGAIVRRLVSILKKRESSYDRTIREVTIDHNGIVVRQPFPATGQPLTGRPHVNPDRADNSDR